jgi:hypothetical protein
MSAEKGKGTPVGGDAAGSTPHAPHVPSPVKPVPISAVKSPLSLNLGPDPPTKKKTGLSSSGANLHTLQKEIEMEIRLSQPPEPAFRFDPLQRTRRPSAPAIIISRGSGTHGFNDAAAAAADGQHYRRAKSEYRDADSLPSFAQRHRFSPTHPLVRTVLALTPPSA